MTIFCGTAEYLAPETLTQRSWDAFGLDYWSLGILIFEMLTGATPYEASDTSQVFTNILITRTDGHYSRYSSDLSDDAMDIISALTNRNVEKRLRAPQIFRHPFFDGMDWKALLEKKIKAPYVPENPYFTNKALNKRVLLLPP